MSYVKFLFQRVGRPHELNGFDDAKRLKRLNRLDKLDRLKKLRRLNRLNGVKKSVRDRVNASALFMGDCIIDSIIDWGSWVAHMERVL